MNELVLYYYSVNCNKILTAISTCEWNSFMNGKCNMLAINFQ